MESLEVICPKCNTLCSTAARCQCDYNFHEDELLVLIVMRSYNNAVRLLSKNNIPRAWDEIRENIRIYPFLISALNLAYILSIQNGEYQYAYNIISKLKPVLSTDEFNQQIAYLYKEVDIYNRVIRDNFDIDQVTDQSTSFIHKHIISLHLANNTITREVEHDNLSADGKTNNNLKIKYWKGILLGVATLLSLILIVTLIFHIRLKDNLNVLSQKNKELLLLSQSAVGPEMPSGSEINNNRLNFYDSFHSNRFIDSADILIANPSLIKEIPSHIIDRVMSTLYGKHEFSKIVDIEHESSLTAHANYRLAWQQYNTNPELGIRALERWVNQFPFYQYYTGQALFELIKHYENKDIKIAKKYALTLKDWISRNADNKEYSQYNNSILKRVLSSEN